MEELIYLEGQRKIIRRKLFRFSAFFLAIGLFIGCGLGYAWRMKQIAPEKEMQIAKIQKLEETIKYYRNHWTPIKQKELKAGKRKK